MHVFHRPDGRQVVVQHSGSTTPSTPGDSQQETASTVSFSAGTQAWQTWSLASADTGVSDERDGMSTEAQRFRLSSSTDEDATQPPSPKWERRALRTRQTDELPALRRLPTAQPLSRRRSLYWSREMQEDAAPQPDAGFWRPEVSQLSGLQAQVDIERTHRLYPLPRRCSVFAQPASDRPWMRASDSAARQAEVATTELDTPTESDTDEFDIDMCGGAPAPEAIGSTSFTTSESSQSRSCLRLSSGSTGSTLSLSVGNGID